MTSCLRRHNIAQVGDNLADMADTAAIVALADITIAVDTSVAHLAGALGREAWRAVAILARLAMDAQRGAQSVVSASPASASVRAGDWPGARRGARCAVAHQHNAMMPADQAATRIAALGAGASG